MAQLELQPASAGKTKRKTKASLKIDMTPLVDLGFLLITFFIFTTTMSARAVTKLYMPAEGDKTNVAEPNALTVLLASDNKIYYYQGKWKDAIKNNALLLTNYDMQNGLGKIIRERQSYMGTNKKDLMLLIKPLEAASYKNVIDALDETTINSLTRYAIIEPDEEEVAYLANYTK